TTDITRLCTVEYASGEHCRNRRKKGSEFCHVHQNPQTRTPLPDSEIQAQFLQSAEEGSFLAHYRVARLLAKAGGKIITVGSKGYPDILFEMRGQVFGVEV